MDQQICRRDRKETGGKKKRGFTVWTSITLILPTGVREIFCLSTCLELLIRPQYDSSSHNTACSPHMLHVTPLNRLLCSCSITRRRLMGLCAAVATAEECTSFQLLSEAAIQPCTGAQCRSHNKSQVSCSQECRTLYRNQTCQGRLGGI